MPVHPVHPVHPVQVVLRPLAPGDAGELLTLQRAAYASEAQLYGDPHLPALVQTYDELLHELSSGSGGVHGHAALHGQRLVGAVRVHERDGRLDIARLTVAPDLQGRGIGSRLLREAEERSGAHTAALFTGHLSVANLRLYHRHGYTETHRTPLRAGITLIHLAKRLRGLRPG